MGLFNFFKKEEKLLLEKLKKIKETLWLEAKEAVEILEEQHILMAKLKYKPWKHAVFVLASCLVLISAFLFFLLKFESQFHLFNRTWVAYDHPPLKLTIVSDFNNCLAIDCFKEEDFIVDLMKQRIVPTIKVNYLDQETFQAKKLVETYNIHTLPAFIFEEEIEEIDNWLENQEFFRKQGNKYLFDLKTAMVQPKTFLLVQDPEKDNFIFGKDKEAPSIIIQWFVDIWTRQSIETIEKMRILQAKYPAKIQVFLYNININQFETNSYNLALAWECFQEQKQQVSFLDIIKAEFNKDENIETLDELYDVNKIKEIAESLSDLDLTQFNVCFNEEKYETILENNFIRAEELGLLWLPTFILNNKVMDNELEVGDLESLIKKHLD